MGMLVAAMRGLKAADDGDSYKRGSAAMTKAMTEMLEAKFRNSESGS